EPLRLSPLYDSAYVGPRGSQPLYLNAVLEARTRLLPLALLDAAQAVEALHGRPSGTHGCPRTLDVDLLLYGGWTVRHPRLVVPHPRLADRLFVLRPLQDLGVLESRGLSGRLELLRCLQPLQRHAGPGAGDGRELVVA